MKWLAIGIILLFIGVAVAPSINTGVVTASFDDDLMEGAMQVYSTGITCRDFNARGWSALIEQRYQHMLTRWSLKDLRCIEVDRSSVQDHVAPESESTMLLQAIGTESTGDHPPIFINGNDDFTAENGVTGGSGTAEDPYIIEGWTIVGDGSSTAGVCIKNTTAFFVIRNCSISNFSGEFSAGIYFNNVTAGTIEHVDAFKNDYGMTIQYSSFIDIVKSVCRDNFDISATGINIYRSHHITIDDCQIYRMTHPPPQDLTHGIWVEGSWNCRINNTICHSNSGYGILLHLWEREYPLQNNTIENCTIYRNGYIGIQLWREALPGSEDLKKIYPGYNCIKNCDIYEEWIGVHSSIMDHTIIENCVFRRNGISVYLDESSRNLIRNCTFYDSDCGIILMDVNIPKLYRHTADNIIEHCDIFNQPAGIESYEARRTIIRYNNIFNCSYHALFGIALRFTTATVYGNNIYDNNISYFYRGSLFDARGNWWGSPLGPSRFFTLRGDLIWTRVGSVCLSYPWATEPIPDAGVIDIR